MSFGTGEIFFAGTKFFGTESKFFACTKLFWEIIAFLRNIV